MTEQAMSGIGSLLYSIWQQQKEYNAKVRVLQPDIKSWNETYALGVISEVGEILQELHWKRHRRYSGAVERDNVSRELADLTKYILSLWQENGFTLSDTLDAVFEKGTELDTKLRTEFLIPKGANVIVSDLDGTVADFRAGFQKFLGAPRDAGQSLSYDLDNGMPFSEYERKKIEFESGGGYAKLPSYPDAVNLLREEQRRGTKLFFTTARPVDRFQRIWGDTQQWLLEHGIMGEHLMFCSEERVFEMLRLEESGNKVLLLEDNGTIAMRAATSGKKVWLRAHPYNEKARHRNITAWVKFPEEINWSEL